MEEKNRSRQQLLAMISFWVGISSTFFVSIMPEIAQYFSISIDKTQTMGLIYYIGYSTGNLLIVFSNRLIGTHRTLVGSLSLATLGLAMMSSTHNYPVFLAAWLIASMGIGSLYILPNIIIKNTCKAEQNMLSFYGRILGLYTLGTCIGPFLSGVVSSTVGWQFILTYNIMIGVMLCLYSMQQDCGKPSENHSQPIACLTDIRRHNMFIPIITSIVNASGYLVCINLIFPILLFYQYGFNALQVGLVLIIPNIAIMIGSSINQYLKHYQPKDLNKLAAYLGFYATIAFIVLHPLFKYSPIYLIAIFATYGICRGLTKPSSLSLALDLINRDANALLPLIIGISAIPTAIIIQLISLIPEQSMVAVSAVLMCLSLIHIWCSQKIDKHCNETQKSDCVTLNDERTPAN
tara:strand:- start:503 stop:1720 length:1218 start_codon:yes stop_codon:yes gene_type:complete